MKIWETDFWETAGDGYVWWFEMMVGWLKWVFLPAIFLIVLPFWGIGKLVNAIQNRQFKKWLKETNGK